MSSRVLNTVPNDIGITVKLRITVSLTRSWARTFSRVASSTSSGVSEMTAAISRKLTLVTSVGSLPRPIDPKRRGSALRMMQ